MDTLDTPIEIKFKRRVAINLLLMSSLGLGLCLSIILGNHTSEYYHIRHDYFIVPLSWIGVPLFAWLVLLSIKYLFNPKSMLILSTQGIHDIRFASKFTLPWSVIKAARACPETNPRGVILIVSSEAKQKLGVVSPKDQKLNWLERLLPRRFFPELAANEVFIDTFDLVVQVDELLTTINSCITSEHSAK